MLHTSPQKPFQNQKQSQSPTVFALCAGLPSAAGAADVWDVLWLQEVHWGQIQAAWLPADSDRRKWNLRQTIDSKHQIVIVFWI